MGYGGERVSFPLPWAQKIFVCFYGFWTISFLLTKCRRLPRYLASAAAIQRDLWSAYHLQCWIAQGLAISPFWPPLLAGVQSAQFKHWHLIRRTGSDTVPRACQSDNEAFLIILKKIPRADMKWSSLQLALQKKGRNAFLTGWHWMQKCGSF